MQFELFPLTEIDDRQIFTDTSHHTTATSTKNKRPQNKLDEIQKPQENIGTIAQVGDRIAIGDHVWEVLELWPDFLVVSDGTRSKHVYRHELTSRRAYQVRFISQAQTTKTIAPLPKTAIAHPPNHSDLRISRSYATPDRHYKIPSA